MNTSPAAIARRIGFTLIEILIAIAIIGILLAFLLPALERARERANNLRCAANLNQIGVALLIYANDNHGQYPRTIYDPAVAANGNYDGSNGGAPKDPFATAVKNDMMQAIFLLIRTQDITPEVFVCPSSNDEPIGPKTVE